MSERDGEDGMWIPHWEIRRDTERLTGERDAALARVAELEAQLRQAGGCTCHTPHA